MLPSFIQTGNGEPRKAHFLGRPDLSPNQKQDQGRKNDNLPQKAGSSKYRPLSDITLGEVDDAYQYFRQQLVDSPVQAWVAKNYFCQIPIKSRDDEDRPPVIFGRVKTCFPSEGDLYNIEQMEMYFPRKNAEPDLLHVRYEDLARHGLVRSYCVGVKFYVSENEMQDFARSENIFIERGFAPLYETSYIDLLNLGEQNRDDLPWMYVIGSEWFASIPADTFQPEIREQLRRWVHWKKDVLNYHPKRYAMQFRSLNDELDFNYGFTQDYLFTPQDVKQTLDKIESVFAQRFMRGIEKS